MPFSAPLQTHAITVPIRDVGLCGGDLVDALQEEIRRRLRAAGGNRVRAIETAFDDLHKEGCLSDTDLRYLHRLVAIVFEVDRGTRTSPDGATALELLGREAMLDPKAAGLTGSMIGVAYSQSQKETMAIGGLFGMAVGGLLGFAVGGGPGGASLGALIGGMVGAWATGLCEANA
jgi:hypothetical protein